MRRRVSSGEWEKAAAEGAKRYVENIGKAIAELNKCDESDCPFWRPEGRCISSGCVHDDMEDTNR